MATKHTSRAVCAVRRERREQPFRYRYDARSGVHAGHRVTVRYDEIGDVEMTIDLAALIDYMGRRALVSSRGVSKLQGGMVTAKVTNRRQANEERIDNMKMYSGIEIVEG